MKKNNRALYQHQHRKTFTIKRKKEKSELNLQISKVSGKKIVTIDLKIYGLQLAWLSKRKRSLMVVIDFILIKGQQSFEDEAKINPIEMTIENDEIQNLFEKYRSNSVKFKLEGWLFSISIKNDP